MLSLIMDRFFKSWRKPEIVTLARDAELLGILMFVSGRSYSYDALAGGDGQAHQTGAVNGHDAIADAQLSGAFRGAAVQQVGHDHCRQDRAPAGLHDRHAQDLSRLL